jgi:hypothetical protein
MVAAVSYVSYMPETVSLAEGERVYVVERFNADWWFVRKKITLEQGFIPSKVLTDSASYTYILRDKLDLKIEKLAVFKEFHQEEEDESIAPTFTVKLFETEEVEHGDTLVLECQVTGNPRPNITWFKQSTVIQSSNDFQMYYNEDNVAKLIIKNVTNEFEGNYTVAAKNKAGSASCSCKVFVEGNYYNN